MRWWDLGSGYENGGRQRWQFLLFVAPDPILLAVKDEGPEQQQHHNRFAISEEAV
jgi:hypothetical protein